MSLVPAALWLWILAGWPAALVGGTYARVWAAVIGLYAALILGAGVLAALRFRSLQVGLLSTAALAATHVAYALGFVRGLASSERNGVTEQPRLDDREREP
jgi:hypothetical protein